MWLTALRSQILNEFLGVLYVLLGGRKNETVFSQRLQTKIIIRFPVAAGFVPAIWRLLCSVYSPNLLGRSFKIKIKFKKTITREHNIFIGVFILRLYLSKIWENNQREKIIGMDFWQNLTHGFFHLWQFLSNHRTANVKYKNDMGPKWFQIRWCEEMYKISIVNLKIIVI